MLLKPLEKFAETSQPKRNVKEIKPRKLTRLAYVKIGFLIIALGIGAYLASNYANLEYQIVRNATKKSSSTFALQNQAGKLTQQGSELIIKAISEQGLTPGNILGTTSKLAETAATQTAAAASDYVYEHTVEEIVKKLISILPESRKKALEQWMKRQN